MGPQEGEGRDPKSRAVCITSYRVNLLDPGANLWGSTKYIEDSLRYAGLIYDDSERFIQIQVRQVKVAHFCDERTEIEIIYPNQTQAQHGKPTNHR